MYETFDHTADLGLRIHAATLAELLHDAARGLTSVICPNLATIRPVVERTITLPADEPELLLFDWLNELLYLFEVDGLLLAEFTLDLTDAGLTAHCRGEPVDRARHTLEHEVKAITYHGLKVEPSSDGWLAEVIVDI